MKRIVFFTLLISFFPALFAQSIVETLDSSNVITRDSDLREEKVIRYDKDKRIFI